MEMDSPLAENENDLPLDRAIKFAKSKIILRRLVVARTLVDLAHEVQYDDFVAHLFPSQFGNRCIDTEYTHSNVCVCIGALGFLAPFILDFLYPPHIGCISHFHRSLCLAFAVIQKQLIADPQPEIRSAVLFSFGSLAGFLIQAEAEKG